MFFCKTAVFNEAHLVSFSITFIQIIDLLTRKFFTIKTVNKLFFSGTKHNFAGFTSFRFIHIITETSMTRFFLS